MTDMVLDDQEHILMWNTVLERNEYLYDTTKKEFYKARAEACQRLLGLIFYDEEERSNNV